jgi:ribonuclease HII
LAQVGPRAGHRVGRLIGIDEAGRGPILGPMVMAVVAVTPEQEAELRGRGVRDSKKYGSGKRAKEARRADRLAIRAWSTYKVLSLSAAEVDEWVRDGKLDELERQGALRLLEAVGATLEDRIICDGEPIFGRLTLRWPNLVAENKADANHICVAAASVLAKAARDEAMDEIRHRYESEFGKIVGGGYVNAHTREFLDAYVAKHGELPPEARKTWKWRPTPEPEPQPDILNLLGGSE